MNRSEYLVACREVRKFIADHPGATREEIERETGRFGCIETLRVKRLIRARGQRTRRYYVVPMECSQPVEPSLPKEFVES